MSYHSYYGQNVHVSPSFMLLSIRKPVTNHALNKVLLPWRTIRWTTQLQTSFFLKLLLSCKVSSELQNFSVGCHWKNRRSSATWKKFCNSVESVRKQFTKLLARARLSVAVASAYLLHSATLLQLFYRSQVSTLTRSNHKKVSDCLRDFPNCFLARILRTFHYPQSRPWRRRVRLRTARKRPPVVLNLSFGSSRSRCSRADCVRTGVFTAIVSARKNDLKAGSSLSHQLSGRAWSIHLWLELALPAPFVLPRATAIHMTLSSCWIWHNHDVPPFPKA